ncbi:gamma-glutamyltransferase [Thiotrichales bacterium 19S11-10]|nr:gamma-glutamyltransferase [Thiotrichales bacterium 19S11-10]
MKFTKYHRVVIVFIIYFFLLFQSSYAAYSIIQETPERFHPVISNQGMVASQEAIASEVGAAILAKGGNAVDAAVAVGFALAVTLPKAGNLGGGGFMIIWLNDHKKAVAINYREVAPLKASKDMFLNDKGNVDIEKITGTYKASGVPGTVKGLVYAQKKYGVLSLKQVMAPAINLAKYGIIVTYSLAESLDLAKPWLSTHAETRKVYFDPKTEKPYRVGDLLVQLDLAKTLKRIADTDGEDFYQGETAKMLARDMKANGGLITMEDLSTYQVEEMAPIKGNYRGYTIYSMPPPSSGGVILVELLNILEGFNLKSYGLNSAKSIHLMTEAQSYAYNDRNSNLGDPNFVHNPVDHLTSKAYAESIRKKINENIHTPSKKISDIEIDNTESFQTTQFSVIDSNGNMVSNTYTLNYSYGNGIVAKDLGFFLNNEMDDFTAKVGASNSFGLVQGGANSIEPGKRPLSSMTPTVILTPDNKPYIVTGSPGGSRIITTTLQVIMNVLEYKLNLQSAVNMPRVHSQLWPDQILIEQGISQDTIKLLESMGHQVVLGSAMGSANSVSYSDGLYYGASDPRRVDSASVGFDQFNG